MTASYQSKDELLSALKWQADMGIDCALRDTAIGLYAADMAQMPVAVSASVSAPVSASTPISAHPPSNTPSVTALADTMPSIPHTFGDDASSNALPCARSGDLSALQTLEDLKSEIGRAHVRTPVTSLSRMPSSA